MQYFSELEIGAYKGATIFLDVDGTLVADGGDVVADNILQKVKALVAVAQVYIVSNGTSSRSEYFAKLFGATPLVGFKKPSVKIVQAVAPGEWIVVGDKVLTDGIFAWRIGAKFVQVQSVRTSHESVYIRVSYMIDTIFAKILAYTHLVRVHQWVKNILVVAPLFFSGMVSVPAACMNVFLAFILFCFLSGFVYVFNDITDRHADALHPTKRKRPLASGVVTIKEAVLVAGVLLGASVLILWFLPGLLVVGVMFLLLNVLYSVRAKHVVVVDVVSVASSHVLRVVAGGIAAGVVISPWIVLCTFFGALFLVIGKRRAELRHEEKRRVLITYTKESLSAMLVLSVGLALMSYGIYSIVGNHGPYMVYSTGFVAVALLRVLHILMTDAPIAEFPERVVFKDPVVVLSVIGWVAYTAILIYTAQ